MDKYVIDMSQKTSILLILTLFLLMGITACSSLASNTGGAPGSVLFQDDFDATPKGWGTMDRNGGEIAFDYGGLVIKVNLADFMFWTVHGDEFTDSRIDVDAVLMDGPANDNFGVLCRYQDNQNFYGFLVTHDGYYGIFKMQDGNFVLSSEKDDLQYSEAIRQGGVVNHITAVCQGSELRLIVNETLLAEIADDSFSQGQVGLIVGAYDQPGVQILFDNFVVTQP